MINELQKGDRLWISPKKLRPTQSVLGFIELKYKINLIKKMNQKQFCEYTKGKVTPVVIGPKGIYMIDHHHHAYSLIKSKKNKIYIEVKANYSGMTEKNFWKLLEKKKLVYLKNEKGIKINYKKYQKHW